MTQSKINKTLSVAFEEGVIRSWWVALFILLCYFCYEQGLMKKDYDFALLHRQHQELQMKKAAALKKQDDLLRQINSQSDPAYVELILMKGLGLVPEGQTKVLFTTEPQRAASSQISQAK